MSFIFDVVIRALTLFLYQIIAPIPIISNMSPNKKDSDALMNWVKKTLGCWASLFIRIALLNLVIYFVEVTRNSTLGDIGENGLIAQMFILIGSLMFAKKLPKLIEEIIPALKLEGGFQLNTFKRIGQDALGGNLILGATAGVAAGTLAAGTNLATRSLQSTRDENGKLVRFGNWKDKDGNVTRSSVTSGLLKTAGSTVAGGASGMFNAFNRTRKDGKVVGGMWSGYQTAMFAKLQREDNLRKAGVDQHDFGDRVKFAGESVLADVSRYVGVLNAGQEEYLIQSQIELKVKGMEKELEEQQRPFKLYGEYMAFIDGKIKVDDNVKTAQALYDAAFTDDYSAAGDKIDAAAFGLNNPNLTVQARVQAQQNYDAARATAINSAREAAIKAAKDSLDEAKRNAFDHLRNGYDEVDANGNTIHHDANESITRTLSALDNLRTEYSNELGDNKFNYAKANGAFNSGAMYVAQDKMAVMGRESAQAIYDYKFGNGPGSVQDTYGHDYSYYQQEVTRAKVANDMRMTREGQGPGYKPSPDRLGEVRDRQFFGGGHHGGGPRGGGPVGPGPGPGAGGPGPGRP